MENYVYIETYGCSANKNNSEILSGLLTQSGYQLTNNIKIADIIILNTCIVKSKTENKIKRRIQDLAKLYSNKLMIISGCMPETDLEQIKKLSNKALVLGTHHFKDIIKLIKDYKENRLTEKKQKEYIKYKNEEKLLLPKIPSNKLISIIQISEGCLGDCNYCKTKLAKGQLYSYDSDRIINTIKNDLQNGAKEIWITSQDNAAYRLDKKENKNQLPELLKNILSLNHNFKLRLGMMNPNNLYPIMNEMIDIYQSKKLYKFLHIPLQSASDKLLKEMNRSYQIKIVEEIITKFKREIPNITIATDIIVGYPTETEKDHILNLNFVKQHSPDVFNLSKFSSHKGTKAGKLKPLDIKIINKRASELMEMHKKTALENKKKFLNKTISVFVNSKTKIPNIYEARDENYNIVFINSKEKILGKNIQVKITQIAVHYLIGEVLQTPV